MSTYNYMYGRYNYYSLSNRCIPQTNAITDNTKFNVGTLAKVYLRVDEPQNESDCNKLTNHSDPKDIKAFDKNKEICLSNETNVEPPGCKTCSVEDY